MAAPTTMTPIRPGEILQEEYLTPLGVTQHHLAVAIGVPPRRINEIVHGKRWISADTALRLSPLLHHHRTLLGSTSRAATTSTSSATGWARCWRASGR